MARKNWRLRAGKKTPETKPFVAAAGRPCFIQAEAGDGDNKKLPTFEGNAYTGAVMRPMGWWGRLVVDLAGVRVPREQRPVLRQHDHEQIVGHTESVKVEDDGIKITGVLSGDNAQSAEIVTLAKNGFQWQLSIGADPVRTEFLEDGEETEVNGRTVTGPLTISRETELGEISFVPLGADGNTSVAVAASRRKMFMFTKDVLKLARKKGLRAAARFSDEEIDKMSEDEAKEALKKCMAEEEEDAKAEDDKDEDDEDESDESEDGSETETESAKAHSRKAIRAEVSAAIRAARSEAARESRRINEIAARAQKFGGGIKIEIDGRQVDLVPHAIEAGWTPDRVELECLRQARPSGSVGVPGGLAYSTTSPDVTAEVFEAALLQGMSHEFKLLDASFYHDLAPDGKTPYRRVPEHVERDFRAAFNSRYTDQVQQAAHTVFKGRLGIQQFFHTVFRACGVTASFDMKSQEGIRSMLEQWDALDKGIGIRAAGASTINIGNILANVLNKFALQGYLFTEQAWRQICSIIAVNDFKPTKSINMLGDVMYREFGPTGELQHASLTDQAFANQAKPLGRMLTIPWQSIVNDDLSMLSGVPMKLGQGSGLAINDAVWSLWSAMKNGTVNGDDGVSFWRTTSLTTDAAKKRGAAYNPNKITGAASAMSNAALKLVKKTFDNQLDPNGNPLGFDGTKPKLLFPPTLWNDVMTALQSPALVAIALSSGTPTVQGGANVWQNMFDPVMSRYLENPNYGNDAAGWYMLFDPVALATIQICFLGGVDTPAVLTAGPDWNFDRLGISVRGTIGVGVTQQNFRGGVYAVGS